MMTPHWQKVRALSRGRVVRQPNCGSQDQRLTQKSGDWESTNIGLKFTSRTNPSLTGNPIAFAHQTTITQNRASPALQSCVHARNCEWPSHCIRKSVPRTSDA